MPTIEEQTGLPQSQPQTILTVDTVSPVLDPQPLQVIPVTPINPSCEYCTNKEKYQNLTDTYISKVEAKTGEKVQIPFVEELALLLKVEEETLKLWFEDKDHTELIAAIKKLLLIQKVRLLQRAVGRFAPAGAIFLLEKLKIVQ